MLEEATSTESRFRNIAAATFDEVKDVLIQTLGIPKRADTLVLSSRLLGGVPELDSLGVVELSLALERRFGFEMGEEDFSAEVFETMASLVEFVIQKQAP